MKDMKPFVKELEKIRGVNFKGLWWHDRFSDAAMSDFELMRKEAFETLDNIAHLKDEIEDSGVSVEMMSRGHERVRVERNHAECRSLDVIRGIVYESRHIRLVQAFEDHQRFQILFSKVLSYPPETFLENSHRDRVAYHENLRALIVEQV
jgi:hypothetical protein